MGGVYCWTGGDEAVECAVVLGEAGGYWTVAEGYVAAECGSECVAESVGWCMTGTEVVMLACVFALV